ncbi:MAG: peptidoglycan DD-metalloendopeptidase family protein [Candidatus Promineifilaceae bacterium]
MQDRRLLVLGTLLLLAALAGFLLWQRAPAREPQAEAAATSDADNVEVATVMPVTSNAPVIRPPALVSTATSEPESSPKPQPSATIVLPDPTPYVGPVDIDAESNLVSPTATSTVTASAAAVTASATAVTASATAVTLVDLPPDQVDRVCPDPPPLKPAYDRAYLRGEPWPTPDGLVDEHFWLAKPLPGGGRLLITDWLPYGYDAGGRYLIHNGVDAAEPLGTPVLAVADGTVIVAGEDADALYGWRCNWYGHLVVIQLDQEWRGQPVYALYGHVLNLTVQPGQRVTRGQQVAEVGFGGAATLPHLHFEIRVGSNEFGSTRNPLLWLQPPNTRAVLAGRVVDPEGRPWQGVVVTALGRSEGTSNFTTYTYLGDPQRLIKPDESLAENFVFGDLPTGEYQLSVDIQGERYSAEVSVDGGQLNTVEIVTGPFKTPTPEPPAEDQRTPESPPAENQG